MTAASNLVLEAAGMSWDENVHIKLQGHVSQLEKGGVATQGQE